MPQPTPPEFGAAGTGPQPSPYPPPLDLTERVTGQPFVSRFGPCFEWQIHEGQWKLVVSFTMGGGPIVWRVLAPEESSRMLEWMLKSAEVSP